METKPVIFYGAGCHAYFVFDNLNKEYSPVAFCDGNKEKWGTVFMGLPVYSLEDIKLMYPDCMFYITATTDNKYNIINTLMENDIPPSCIINYEEIINYNSCSYLENDIVYNNRFDEKHFSFCFMDNREKIIPFGEIGKNNEETWSNFINMRDKTINALLHPTSYTPHPCQGCSEIKSSYWAKNRRVKHLSLLFKSLCNIKCVYCIDKKYLEGLKSKELIKSAEKAISFFKYLEKNNNINKETFIYLVSGELSIHPHCDEILESIKNYPLFIATNAVVYSENIAGILKKGNSVVYSSIDAGTKESFEKIKSADAFDNVCENIKRYSENGFVELKYMIIPGINDNKEDINGFFNLCKKNKIKSVVIGRDRYKDFPFEEHTKNIAAKLIEKLRQENICVQVIDDIFGSGNNIRAN
jgi:molybdenum cofactor biosynthesis enzyme MoaA